MAPHVLKMPMPWWIRSTVIGAWMNFVLTFFAYNDMQAIMTHTFGHERSIVLAILVCP